MRVVRLAKRAYADLSGIGAAKAGARWNSPGLKVVYAASCGALAALEYMAHLGGLLPSGLMLMLIEIPDPLKIERVAAVPADPAAFRSLGDDWVHSKSAPVLEVPSVLVPRQKNYLINPEHPLFGTIVTVASNPFAFDSRLLSAVSVPAAPASPA